MRKTDKVNLINTLEKAQWLIVQMSIREAGLTLGQVFEIRGEVLDAIEKLKKDTRG